MLDGTIVVALPNKRNDRRPARDFPMTSQVGPSLSLTKAINEIWQLKPPGPENLLSAPEFVRLRGVCRESYPSAGGLNPGFALSTALRFLGLPCWLPKEKSELALPAAEAARRLDECFRARCGKRVHLAPLDLASDLPKLAFAGARLERFSAEELSALVDAPRLRRAFPSAGFDAERFSEFQWLVVEEDVLLDREPEERAVPVLFMNLSEDLGRIEPHKGRFPRSLERALFFLLLAPWESWSDMIELDWRGFRVPWVFTIHSDLFVRPNLPPSPDSLSWEDRIYDDGYGGMVEIPHPTELSLSHSASSELLAWANNENWQVVENARQSVLFETPIVHFLVRAFLADGVDEFLAHITTIEAALGLHGDFSARDRATPDRHRGKTATKRMQGRVAGLLGDRKFGNQYEMLFNIRSAFLHGRPMNPISTEQRILGRALARSVVNKLTHTANAQPISSREVYLDDLLDRGLSLS